ncbi:MAG: TonB-dependent receptor [Candidatus Omnitrophica bacterium]|nr:TonB-dependent receptor [Candidatus Omnitrophota bacterium]
MKIVNKLLILVLIAGIAEFKVAKAQDYSEIELEKIILTSRRTSFNLSEVTENVNVIDENQIKNLPARNLSEVLQYISGVDIAPRQGFGRATSVTIQGSASRQVRVMIDGIPLNNQASGQVDLTKLPIENVSKIEIIKGSASSVWGSSLGGVINIITKDTGSTLIPEGSISSSFAEFRTKKESAEVSGKVGKFGYYQFLSFMETGGEDPKDDVLEKQAFSKISYDLEQMGRVTALFGYSYVDANSGEYPDETWQAQPYRARYGKVNWELKCNDTDITVDFKRANQDIITKTYLSVNDEEPFVTVKTKDMLSQLSLNSNMRLRGEDVLVFGMDFDWNRLKSTYLSKAKDSKSQAAYTNYTLKSGPWNFNMGLRYDHTDEFGEELSPSLGAVYQFKNLFDTLIRANISNAFNIPPLLWKHYDLNLSGLVTNPNIEPERAWVYELGIESRPMSRLWVKCSLYRSDVSDAIALARNETNQYYMKNFEKFRRQGVEVQFKVKVYEELSFFAAGAFNDIEDRTTRETVRGGGKPRQSFDLGVEYKNKNGFNLAFKGYYDRWNEPASSQPNDRKMLFDMKLSREFKNYKIFFNIYNLTNSKYWADYYFPVPERYLESGITFKW